MVRDATAGARNEEGDGYRAALVNFRALAHALWTTRETVRFIEVAAKAYSNVKRRIEKIILAGPAGNICVEAHLRDFLEQGFEVAMVRDATAGARNEEGDGYRAALVNFRALAHALWTTRETVRFIEVAAKAAHTQT
jgi:hypothetical protein